MSRSFCLALLVSALAACSSSSTTSSPSTTSADGGGAAEPSVESRVDTIQTLTGDAASGKTVYTSNCASCHGADGKSGSVKKDVVAEVTGEPDEALLQILKGGGGMPAFKSLSDQQIADLVAHLKSL